MIRCKLVETTHPDDTQVGARVGRAVSGEVLNLGRAAACKIYLPDPRIRLEHAMIRRAEDGALYLEATGPVFIDQKTQTSVRLAVGQKISIGPYDFIVEQVRDGADIPDPRLTLSFALRAQALLPSQGAAAPSGVGFSRGWLGRRSLAWVLSLLVVLVFAAWPVWHAFQPAVPMTAKGAAPLPPSVAGLSGVQGQAMRWVAMVSDSTPCGIRAPYRPRTRVLPRIAAAATTSRLSVSRTPPA
jgi:hypothetical protein